MKHLSKYFIRLSKGSEWPVLLICAYLSLKAGQRALGRFYGHCSESIAKRRDGLCVFTLLQQLDVS